VLFPAGKMTLSDDVNLEEFVMAKDELSGADIKAVCTEAGLLALRERRMRVTQVGYQGTCFCNQALSSRKHVGWRACTGRVWLVYHQRESRHEWHRQDSATLTVTMRLIKMPWLTMILTCYRYV
jgi:SpoVK/Ycf46/Vps4 family AAA+-type ATPase